MKIGSLKKLMSIEDDSNTHINGELKSLFLYAKEHLDETVKSIYVQDNGVVVIKTKIKTN